MRIEPITRVEGHAAITLVIEENKVKSLQVNVTEPPRFFEKLMEGKPAEEVIRISERVCGICYVAHGLAAAKALESAWEVNPPETALKLRLLLHEGGFIHSHTLHIALLALPDFLTPGEGVVGLAKKYPNLCKKAIFIRKYGQEITEIVGGRPIHPSAIVPGGMAKHLSKEDRERLLKKGREVLKSALELVDFVFDIYEKRNLFDIYPEDPTYYVGLVRNGIHEIYDGNVHIMNPKGEIVKVFKPHQYLDYIGEISLSYSFAKQTLIKFNGEKYKVGSLARINLAEKFGTPIADKYITTLRSLIAKPFHNVGAYNLARATELIASIEKALELLEDDQIVSENIRVHVKPKEGVGVGIVEAPRGTLIHHYEIDSRGRVRKANLIIPTQQNIAPLESELFHVANNLVSKGIKLSELGQRLETIVRAYDPCISCATHMVKLRIVKN